MRNIDLSALDTMPLDELAKLPPLVLADLQQEANNALVKDRNRIAILTDALDRRYGEAAQKARQAAGKDTGIVRLADDGCAVIAETKKSVFWDADGLAKLRDRIAVEGDDPAVYIVAETKLTVREASFKEWPANIRAAFEPLRTVRPGKPSYRIERPKAEAA